MAFFLLFQPFSKNIRLLKDYFDADWYLSANPDIDVNIRGIIRRMLRKNIAFRHYLNFGKQEGRRPNAYFDADWYSKRNPGAKETHVDLLTHYVERGWRSGASPSWYFDVNWYLQRNPDVAATGIEPLKHYLKYGRKEGRRANRFATHNASALFDLSVSPLVSIIITNMNGERHLNDLFASLAAQTYRNYEIIFVDDNSTDNSIDLVKRYRAPIQVIKLASNVGFAEANNIGLEVARGELIALLNNDTRVDPNWLEYLVLEMQKDNSVAAVAPRIRFWSEFQRITIAGNNIFSISLLQLVESLIYKKYFVRTGVEKEYFIAAVKKNDGYRIEIDLPFQEQDILIRLLSEVHQVISVGIGAVSHYVYLKNEATDHILSHDNFHRNTGFYIINNAGSEELTPLSPGDRGITQIDRGQFNTSQGVDLFCGASALIRRDSLDGRKLFIGEFTAYYEDSELSKRLRLSGYKILYCPYSIVYHKHSASNVEKSLFWRKQTFKNAILYKYIFSSPSERPALLQAAIAHLDHLGHLNHLEAHYTNKNDRNADEKAFAKDAPLIKSELLRVASLIDANKVPQRTGIRIGVYNRFWSTMGGGEARALHIAMILSKYAQVELISEIDFDVDHLLSFFKINGANVRKRIVAEVHPHLTSQYDIFVNSSFNSELPSLAKLSYYLVSFPNRWSNPEFLKSYYFFANSKYTMSWMKKWWGESFQGEVLYPSVQPEYFVDNTAEATKQKIILSVGRFARLGHTKNQLEIAKAFRQLNKLAPDIAKDWMLCLIGSVNDMSYVADVEEELVGLNHKLILDATFDQTRQLYRGALIYVHASGIGRSLEKEPELFEHFGMAVAQAIASGCVPVVFDAAGPKEIIDCVGKGFRYKTTEELTHILEQLLRAFENNESSAHVLESLSESAKIFSRVVETAQLERHVESFMKKLQIDWRS